MRFLRETKLDLGPREGSDMTGAERMAELDFERYKATA